MRRDRPVLVVGCGGIGGVVASRIAAHAPTIGVTGNDEIAKALVTRGVHATLPEGERSVVFPVVVSAEEARAKGPFGAAILAVPPDRLERASEGVLPLLDDDGVVVVCANGLGEERLAGRMPLGRIVGGVVTFGATMHGPGVVEQTSEGGVVLGRLQGGEDATLLWLQRLFVDAGLPCSITQNLRGARWSKLAVNAAISSLGTIGGDRLGALMRHRFARRLALEVMSEVVEVARAEGVRMERVAGVDLEWVALETEERLMPAGPGLVAKHSFLLAVGAKYRRLRSSMLAALERGRPCPVAFLNGEVTVRGRARGVPTPVNDSVEIYVQRCFSGTLRPSLSVLETLYGDTRGALRQVGLAA